MRCLDGLAFALGIALASAASPVRAQGSVPLQLTLRPSYFYVVDTDPVSAQPESSTRTSTEGQANTLHEARLRVKRTRAGLISMAALTAAGGAMIGAGLAAAARRPREPSGSLSSFSFHPGESAAIAGGFLAVAGGIGMAVTGPLLGVRKRQLRKSQQEDHATLRAGPLRLTSIERWR
jgi:hypothetical protein